MPDDDFELGCPDDLGGDDRPTEMVPPGPGRRARTEPPAIDEFHPMTVSRAGRHVTIAFHGVAILDDRDCLAPHRAYLMQILEAHECEVVTFDLTGVKIVLSGMMGFLASATKCCREVELRNPSPEVLEMLRITRLDTLLMIRGATL